MLVVPGYSLKTLKSRVFVSFTLRDLVVKTLYSESLVLRMCSEIDTHRGR